MIDALGVLYYFLNFITYIATPISHNTHNTPNTGFMRNKIIATIIAGINPNIAPNIILPPQTMALVYFAIKLYHILGDVSSGEKGRAEALPENYNYFSSFEEAR